jgi:hypothetical protein
MLDHIVGIDLWVPNNINEAVRIYQEFFGFKTLMNQKDTDKFGNLISSNVVLMSDQDEKVYV